MKLTSINCLVRLALICWGNNIWEATSRFDWVEKNVIITEVPVY
jgi:hypothetical protein